MPPASQTILLIEDNPDDEALTLRAFAKNKINTSVVIAHDGVEAIDYLFCSGRYSDRNLLDTPSLILLDLKLPRIDGLEVLRRIRAGEHTALIPVVILTTSRETQDIQQAYRLGANSYIRKPVDFEHFINAVEQLSLYWLRLNEAPYGNIKSPY